MKYSNEFSVSNAMDITVWSQDIQMAAEITPKLTMQWLESQIQTHDRPMQKMNH